MMLLFLRRNFRYIVAASIVLIVIVRLVADGHYAAQTSQMNGYHNPAPSDVHQQGRPLISTISQGKKPPPPPPELPLGGRVLFPKYRLVALYGSPDGPALGALGEQPMAATIDRVKKLAADYQPYTGTTMMPALEIIASVASDNPTNDGDYSREADAASLRPWAEAAQKAGVYVTLDLQPGRDDFLTQAKEYASLLQLPNVGLALDPEWRLKPDQVHLTQIGSVDAAEVNRTSAWLAALTAEQHLPQKLFLIHQFRSDMITDRPTLDTSHSQLAYVIQMDGSGNQSQKQDTWQTITRDAPTGLSFGWKNFYTKDTPTLSPQETIAKTPVPDYVSYQ
jgi:hypothetical protein